MERFKLKSQTFKNKSYDTMLNCQISDLKASFIPFWHAVHLTSDHKQMISILIQNTKKKEKKKKNLKIDYHLV